MTARSGAEPKPAIVDGANVAYSTEAGAPRLDNITRICRKLSDEGYKPYVVVDAALRHHIDDADGYERMVEDGRIRQAPAGTDADYFILSFARDLDAVIVSNDRFRDHADEFRDIEDRAIRYMILEGDVVLKRPEEQQQV